VPRGQRDGSLRPYSRFSRLEPLAFLSSDDSVDAVTDPLLLRRSGSTGNRTRISGSVARNSDHQPGEAAVQSSRFRKIDVAVCR
jgi:hypothetical protein